MLCAMTSIRVEEVTAPAGLSPERFAEDYVRGGRPVVLRGLVSGWPARGWGFPQIASQLPARAIEGCGLSAADGLSVRRVSMEPEELVRRLTSDGEVAGEAPDWFFDVPTELPELFRALPAPPITRGRYRYGVAIGRDTCTRGHYHSHEHALISQVHGQKRIILYPPTDFRRLYPHPRRLHRSPHEYSRVDFSNPDLAEFPELKGARRLELVLSGGDALFVPVHWWHAVYGLGAIMSVSMLWNAAVRDYRFRQSGLRAVSSPIRQRVWPLVRGLFG